MGIMSFETQIRALHGLSQMCLEVRMVRLCFVSSIEIARVVPYAFPGLVATDVALPYRIGYAHSKFCGRNRGI